MDYSFQSRLEAEAWEKLGRGRVVLAAAPGAGKTDMAIRLIGRWTKAHEGRALVLTHGQTILRDQFYDRLKRDVRPFRYGRLGETQPNMRVHVGLPHHFIRRPAEGYGLIVVDEAHQFYRAPMVQSILEQNPEAKVLLLTGSPSWFVGANFPVVSMSAFELLEHGVISDPRVEIVQTDLPFTHRDYNAEEELRTEAKMTAKQISGALDGAMEVLCGELLKRHAIGKTLVVCNRQTQAKAAQRYFAKLGVEALISTSDSDKGEPIAAFKTGPAPVLVVVNRATLGFDMPALLNVIDISCSMNPDRLFQALCRVVRKHGDAPKTYVKVTPVATAELTHHVMSFVMGLAAPEIYRTWDGAWKDVRTAKSAPVKARESSEAAGEGTPRVNLPRLYTFREVADVERGALQAVAWSSFTETKRRLSESSRLGAEAVRLYIEELWESSDIERHLDTWKGFVQQAVKAAGLSMRPRDWVAPEIVKDWERRFREGEKVKEIAKAYGCYYGKVSKHLKRSGLVTKKTAPAELVHEWVRRWNGGENAAQIAEGSGFSRTAVKWNLTRAGIALGDRTWHEAHGKVYPVSEWIALKQGGATVKEIGQRFEVSSSTVAKKLRESGIKTDLSVSVDQTTWCRRYRTASAKQIAQEDGVDMSTVVRWLKRQGVVLRTPAQARALAEPKRLKTRFGG